MKRITRENANVDRIACPWLIRRFIDGDAEFLFVARDQVLAVAEREGGHSYDADGAGSPTVPGNAPSTCSSKSSSSPTIPPLSDSRRSCTRPICRKTATLRRRAPGLYAIAHGFALLHGTEDQRKIQLETPMYDALYAGCQDATGSS
jgi:hypothetical protein